jgi:hypothetical protein
VLPAVCVHESSYTQFKYDPDPLPGAYTPTQSVLDGLETPLQLAVTAPPVPTAEGVPDNVGVAAKAVPVCIPITATSGARITKTRFMRRRSPACGISLGTSSEPKLSEH